MGFELPVPGLVEVVVGNGLRLSGIERRGLVEVARGVARFCGFGFGATEIELYLGWPACGIPGKWGRPAGRPRRSLREGLPTWRVERRRGRKGLKLRVEPSRVWG